MVSSPIKVAWKVHIIIFCRPIMYTTLFIHFGISKTFSIVISDDEVSY